MGNVKKENHTIVRKVKLKVNHCLVGMKSQNLVLASQLKFPQQQQQAWFEIMNNPMTWNAMSNLNTFILSIDN
jgi:hypothetical protein